MEDIFHMVSNFNGLDWATTSPNFQPTPLWLDGPSNLLPQNNQPPTSTSSSTCSGSNVKDSTPIAKFQVCSSCRRKKRKCSLDRPSCSLCLENNWSCEYRYIKKKPGPTRRSGSTAVAAPTIVTMIPESILSTTSSPATSIFPTVSDYAHTKLMELYFIHIQPMFPMFCRRSLERDFTQGRIPNKLLYAFYAISSKFAAPEEIHTLLGSSSSMPWDIFARIAERESKEQEDQNVCISLNDIKADILRTLYEYTNFPGRKALMMIGHLVRMALTFGLHHIDCGIRNTNLTDFEVEEHRFVWWAVWKLDSATSTLTSSPFGIDCQSIGTALVSTTIADFTAGKVMKSKQQFIPTDSSRMWTSAHDLLTTSTEDGMNMYLLAVCHLRTVTQCRQRLLANTTPELIRQFMVLRNTLSCMRLSLPEGYFDPSRYSALESPSSHRARLEALLVLHISQVQCFLPLYIENKEDFIEDNSVSNWKMCVASGEDITAIFCHWKPEYFAVADPFVSTILWFTIIMLTLHVMSIYGQSEEGPDVRISNALDLLNLALENFARYWQFSRLLLDSVKHLQGWNWLKIDFLEVMSLMAQLRIPMNPLKQEPGSIDMWQIVGNVDDVAVEETATGQGLE